MLGKIGATWAKHNPHTIKWTKNHWSTPKSTWSRGGKSNSGFVPCNDTCTASSSPPTLWQELWKINTREGHTGVLGWVIFGSWRASFISLSSALNQYGRHRREVSHPSSARLILQSRFYFWVPFQHGQLLQKLLVHHLSLALISQGRGALKMCVASNRRHATSPWRKPSTIRLCFKKWLYVSATNWTSHAEFLNLKSIVTPQKKWINLRSALFW